MTNTVTKGRDVLLYLNDVELGGQKAAKLVQQTTLIDISDEIQMAYKEYMPGPYTWYIVCEGLIIHNEECFNLLIEAFKNKTALSVKITDEKQTYYGTCYVTQAPIDAKYNAAFSYNVVLTGTGGINNG